MTPDRKIGDAWRALRDTGENLLEQSRLWEALHNLTTPLDDWPAVLAVADTLAKGDARYGEIAAELRAARMVRETRP